jgi:tagatose 6-phosphate kinase
VKPNLAELSDLTDVADPREAARELSLASGAAVAVTLGAGGIVLAAEGEVWHGSLAESLHGNPTGAGDAAMAAFARGISASAPWPSVLHDAVALSGAAVLAAYAGEFDASHYRALSEQVVRTGP